MFVCSPFFWRWRSGLATDNKVRETEEVCHGVLVKPSVHSLDCRLGSPDVVDRSGTHAGQRVCLDCADGVLHVVVSRWASNRAAQSLGVGSWRGRQCARDEQRDLALTDVTSEGVALARARIDVHDVVV
jgi:hypothetical protein